MNPILELAEVRNRAVPLSVASYEWMSANGLVSPRTELIRGIVVEKTGKSPLHTQLTDRLSKLITAAVGHEAWVRSEAPLVFQDSVTEPDVSVVPGQDRDYSGEHPRKALLVVEVAVSSEALDREMISVYAEAGVPEFWLVLARTRRIECHSSPGEGAYRTVRIIGDAERLVSVSLPQVSIAMDALFDS